MFHLTKIFLTYDSRYQKYRLRKSIEEIACWVDEHTSVGTQPAQFDLVYKNKNFKIGTVVEKVNYHYTLYRIFINGEEAGNYHRLQHDILNSYYFDSVNRRDEFEVRAIIEATSKAIKKLKKTDPKETPRTLYDSYFK
jgi:hypothetical protein